MIWVEITETEFRDALEVLPPALRLDHGFLLDEPTIHKDGRPCYSPYLQIGGHYYAGSEPMTIPEFRALRIDELALPGEARLPAGTAADVCSPAHG
jgi:hypothetical protein